MQLWCASRKTTIVKKAICFFCICFFSLPVQMLFWYGSKKAIIVKKTMHINPLSYGLFCAFYFMSFGPHGLPYKYDCAGNKRLFWWRQRGQSAPGHAKIVQTVPTSPPTHKKVIVYKVWGQCILRFKLVYTAKRLSKSTYEKSMKHSCKSNKANTFLWIVVSLIVLVFRSRQKQYLP